MRETLITVDIGELKKESENLRAFMQSEISAPMTVRGKILSIDSPKGSISPRNVKTLVKRFLHKIGWSEAYRVTEENAHITVRKREKERLTNNSRTGEKPSAHQRLPYFFPSRQ